MANQYDPTQEDPVPGLTSPQNAAASLNYEKTHDISQPAQNTPKAANPASSGQGKASAPDPNSYINPQAFSNAIAQAQQKLETNSKLVKAKQAIFKHMYDQPLTKDETAALTPSLKIGMMAGDRNMIDMSIQAINDQIKGYDASIDNNLANYVTAANSVSDLTQKLYSQAATMIQNNVSPNTVATLIQNASGGMINPTDLGFTSGVNIPAGTLAAANNNPGNLRYVGQPGASEGQGGFAAFATPQEGMQALEDQISLDSSRGESVGQFVSKYAPPTENNTSQYIQQFCSAVGVTQDTPLSACDPQKVAQFMAQKESGTKINWSYPGGENSSAQDWANNIVSWKDTMSDVPSSLRTQVNSLLTDMNYVAPAELQRRRTIASQYPKLISSSDSGWFGSGIGVKKTNSYEVIDPSTGQKENFDNLNDATAEQNKFNKSAGLTETSSTSDTSSDTSNQDVVNDGTQDYTLQDDGTYLGDDGKSYQMNDDGTLTLIQ